MLTAKESLVETTLFCSHDTTHDTININFIKNQNDYMN